ncbi:MAG TPA: 50S ribosomal protein L11 methyltransferase [Thermoleophilaceae bacterium]|nr:50S ribosomal protein L11 methyltransferase [Thermoleophilaceae bacterium]
MIRLAIRAPAADGERVLAALLELAPSGVEQVDGDGSVEFAVYGAPGELPELDEGEAEVGGILVTVSGREVPDDWDERWKRFHAPVLVANRLYVRPPWEEPPLRPGVIDLRIDPGRAFGTGAHATTRLCLDLLVDLAGERPRGSLCDLGCGSGVLSIAAAKLGYGPIEAVDSDGLAVDATKLNARDNDVALEVVRRANLREEAPPPADVVVANLMRPLLLRVAQLIDHRPDALVLSGLLDHEADEVAAAFAPLAEARRLSDRGWTALLLT